MLEVKIPKHLLGESIDFFFEIPLKGKRSRHRSRFIKLLNEHLSDLAEEQQILLKEHCHLDENGNPKLNEVNQDYNYKDKKAFEKDNLELFKEEIIICEANHQDMLKSIRAILKNFQDPVKGRKAVLYDYLCETFKVDE